MGKAAVMNALKDGKNVDVKCFILNGDGKCEAKVASVLYPGQEHKQNNKAWCDAAKKRADGILRADNRKDNKIIAALNKLGEKLHTLLPKLPKKEREAAANQESRRRTDIASREMASKAHVRTTPNPKLNNERVRTNDKSLGK